MSESRKDEKNVKKTEELRERLSDEEYERRRQIRKKRIELRRKKRTETPEDTACGCGYGCSCDYSRWHLRGSS